MEHQLPHPMVVLIHPQEPQQGVLQHLHVIQIINTHQLPVTFQLFHVKEMGLGLNLAILVKV